MKKYTKTYLDFFGYIEQDFIPSEISGSPAVDIHHIIPRSQGGKDNIRNLIGLTREEHKRAHGELKPKISIKKLQEIHDNLIFNNLLPRR